MQATLHGDRNKMQEVSHKAVSVKERKEQNMTQAIMQAAIEATKAAIIMVREVDNLVGNAKPIHTMASIKTTNVWLKTLDKYQELYNFEIEVKNIAITSNYNTQESIIPIILNWLRAVRTHIYTDTKWWGAGKCRTSMGLFEVLSGKFKSHHNKLFSCCNTVN